MSRRFVTEVVQGSFVAGARRRPSMPTWVAILAGVLVGALLVAGVNWYRPTLLPVQHAPLVAAHCPEVAEFRQRLDAAHVPSVERDQQPDEYWQAASLWAHAVDEFPECFTAKDQVSAKAYLDVWRIRMGQ